MATIAAISGWIGLVSTLEPGLVSVVTDIVNLIKKNPGVTLQQWQQLMGAVVTTVQAEDAETVTLAMGDLAKILAQVPAPAAPPAAPAPSTPVSPATQVLPAGS